MRVSIEFVAAAAAWLADSDLWADAVVSNYQVGLRYFSYEAAAVVIGEALDGIVNP